MHTLREWKVSTLSGTLVSILQRSTWGKGISQLDYGITAPTIVSLLYSHYGLFVTWAQVTQSYRSRVERFLIDRLRPLVNENRPVVEPLPVNIPW